MTAPAAPSVLLPIFATTHEYPHARRLEFSAYRDRKGVTFLSIALRDSPGRVAIPLTEAELHDLVALLGPAIHDGDLFP